MHGERGARCLSFAALSCYYHAIRYDAAVRRVA